MPQPICKVLDVTEKGRELRVPGEKVPRYLMLFRRGERLVAYFNECPHENRSLNLAPDCFMVGDDGLLVCAHHGACFDLDSGQCLHGPCAGKCLQTCPITIREGMVWLD